MEQADGIPTPENDPSPQSSRKDDTSTTRRRALRQALRATAAATAAALLGGTGALAQAPTGLSLVLRYDDLPIKADAFYKELKNNNELQSEFINNPAELIVRRFLPPDAASAIFPQRLSNANRVLYSVLSNNGFRAWAENYQQNIDKTGRIDKGQIVKDFSAAIVRYGNMTLLQGLMEENSMRQSHLVVIVEYFVAAISIAYMVYVLLIGYRSGSGGSFTAAELRALTDRIVARAQQLERSGALKESFIR